MRLRVLVFGGLGACLTVVAAAAVLAPDLLLALGPFRRAVAAAGGVEPTSAMLLASGVTGLYLALAARSDGTAPPGRDRADERFAAAAVAPPEAVTAERRRLTAADLDDGIRRAVVAGGEHLRKVGETLAGTAERVYAERADVDEERAREAVRTGAWTDDRVAAAFLAGEAGPDPTVRDRIRLWLAPRRERRRRIERTVGAIERLEGEP